MKYKLTLTHYKTNHDEDVLLLSAYFKLTMEESLGSVKYVLTTHLHKSITI